jgi:hypothetical protein
MNCELVERFDEVMTLKASKIRVDELILETRQNYDK